MEINSWNVSSSVDRCTPCNHALNFFIYKNCKGEKNAHTLQLLAYPASVIDTLIRMAVLPFLQGLKPLHGLYTAAQNGQNEEFKRKTIFLLPTYLLLGVGTVISEVYYTAALLVHLSGILTLTYMHLGYKRANSYFEVRERMSKSTEGWVLDLLPNRPAVVTSRDALEKPLNVRTFVQELTPCNHILNMTSLESYKGTWSAHVSQFLSYPASVVDTLIRMIVLPFLELLAPLYVIYKNALNGNSGHALESVLFLPITYAWSTITTAFDEVYYAVALAVHITGITTLIHVFQGDERAESYFNRRERIFQAAQYGAVIENVAKFFVEAATLISGLYDFKVKLDGFFWKKNIEASAIKETRDKVWQIAHNGFLENQNTGLWTSAKVAPDIFPAKPL